MSARDELAEQVAAHGPFPMPTGDPLIVSRFDTAIEPAPEEEPVLIVGAVADDGRPVALLLNLEARSKVARWLAPELEETGLASPWERAVAGLNALVDADIAFHVEPDGHISNPFGDEHIEWDHDAARWRLVHDDEDDDVHPPHPAPCRVPDSPDCTCPTPGAAS